MSNLYGIDVSAHQPENITELVKYDFAVVKVSGNPKQSDYKYNYVNPLASAQLKHAYDKTGLVGCYHFTYGLEDPTTEADFFISTVKKLGYLNKAILVVDYEGPAVKLGRSWILKFCDRIKGKAYTPILYSYASAISSQNLGSLGYPIWCANYYKGNKTIVGYDTKDMKIGYEKSKMWQFTSTCALEGYKGKLDANVFFGTKTEWKKLANIQTKPTTQTISQWYQVVSDDGMNVRQSYTVSSKKLKTIPKDTKFKASKKHGNWVYSEEYKGWICVKSKSKVYLKGIDAPAVKKETAPKKTTVTTKKESKLTKVAKDVIAGKYGNGLIRKMKLRIAGYNPTEVQNEVNRLLKK